jgi:hypothetical protein
VFDDLGQANPRGGFQRRAATFAGVFGIAIHVRHGVPVEALPSLTYGTPAWPAVRVRVRATT